MKRALANAALVISSMIVAVLLAEGLLRLTEHRYALAKVRFPDGYFVNDAVLGARHAANHPAELFRFPGPSFETFTNSHGCFDFEHQIEGDYLLVIGDSATWGYVPIDENWPTHLGNAIGRQVLKCGVVGIGTRYETVWLDQLVKRIGIHPSMVVLLYTSNDLNDDVAFPSYRVVRGQRLDAFRSLDLANGRLERYSDAELQKAYAEYEQGTRSIRAWLRENSVVSWIIYRALFSSREAPIPSQISSRYEVDLWQLDDSDRPWLRAAKESHISQLIELSNHVRNMGASFVVFDHDVGPHNQVLAARLPDHVDFYYQLEFDDEENPERLRYFHPYDGHWNIDGARMAATEMARALQAANIMTDAGVSGP